MEEIRDILEDFYYDHQRGIVATIIVIVGLIVAYIVYLMLYNPIKIRFEGEDTQIVATTMSTKLEYNAVAYDKNTEGYPLTWEVSGGTLNKNNGTQVVWELPKNAGSYTITAKSGESQSARTVTVIENILSDSLEEKEIVSIDTDKDGLTDEYEEATSLTDPKNVDSDGDGLTDGNEVLLGLNPTSADSKSDGINDSQRKVKYSFTEKNTNAKIEITGTGNLTKTTVDMFETTSLSNMREIISPVYYIFSEANIDNMNVTLKYDKNIVNKKGLNEDLLSVYVLDESTNKFIKLESTLNKDESSITIQIKENAKLFIADSSTMKNGLATELMFVIDNSGSMYSKEQIAESSENDVDFKRLSTANKMIDKLKGDYKFGAGKFTFEYTELAAFTTDKEFVKEKINSVKTLTEKFTGTYIGEALSGGLKQFSDENTTGARRYLILLTDGKDTTDVEGYDENKIKNAIEEAKRKGVKVYTIGLGREIDQNVLKNIATQTSGKYYYALNADVLNSLFEIIAAQVNFSFVDSDNNNSDDSIIIADSGFITKRDGFSFDNIPLINELNGCNYGMSLFSKLYYEKSLPNSLSKMTVKVPDSDKIVKANGYNLDNIGLEGYLYENNIVNLEILSEVPKDFRSGGIVNSVLKIKDDYQITLNSSGFKMYEQNYNKSKAMFDRYEIFILDMESIEYIEGMNESGKSYFDAITRLDILKYRDDTISFKDNPEQVMNNLKDSLINSKTVILKLNDTYTVNAIRIVEDNTNANKFKIEVYDPNVAGIERYIECTRSKVYMFDTKSEMTKKVDEVYIYEFTYNGKKVDVKISIPNIKENL